MPFTNFSVIFHAFDKVSSCPPQDYEKKFLFCPVRKGAKSPVRLRIRPSISQNNTLLGNAAVSPSLSAVVWAAEDSASANGWQFKAFGTSSAANVNTLADGADIHGKVTLNACTVKEDGTIFPF